MTRAQLVAILEKHEDCAVSCCQRSTSVGRMQGLLTDLLALQLLQIEKQAPQLAYPSGELGDWGLCRCCKKCGTCCVCRPRPGA